MKDIRRPEFMNDIYAKKGHRAFVEILIAIALYFVGSIFSSFIMIPIQMIYLFTNSDYITMIRNSSFDFSKITDLVMNMPEWIMVANLFSEIGLILVVLLYCRFLEKRKLSTLGFHKKGFLLEYGKGILIGLFAIGSAYMIALITGSVSLEYLSSSDFKWIYLFAFLGGYLIQGMAEEVLLRGYFMVSLSRRYSVSMSVIISALLFAILHGLNPGMTLLSYINLFLYGLFAALLFIKTKNIWMIAAFHSVWNFVQGNIFGIQVSGLNLQASLFTSTINEKKELINGGSFGIEGGLAVTLVLLIGIAIIWKNMDKNNCFVEIDITQNNFGMNGKMNFKDNVEQKIESPKEVQTEEIISKENRLNMGVNVDETPWHPQEKKDEIKEFDQSYFKD